MPSARSLYTAFHAEAPREAYERKMHWPDNPVIVGRAKAITYRSDKWHEGVHDYEHRIDGDVIVICDRSARTFGAIGGSPSIRSPWTPKAAGRLGTAVELVAALDDGRTVRVKFDAGRDLYSGPELVAWTRAGLHYYAILSKPAIILRSRDMVVTPAGLDG